MRLVHSSDGNGSGLCYYSPSPRHENSFHCNDHLRDHLRDFHMEDIPMRRIRSWLASDNHAQDKGKQNTVNDEHGEDTAVIIANEQFGQPRRKTPLMRSLSLGDRDTIFVVGTGLPMSCHRQVAAMWRQLSEIKQPPHRLNDAHFIGRDSAATDNKDSPVRKLDSSAEISRNGPQVTCKQI
jgi:hypothetical protein